MKIAVIGGGASGIMCAIAAKRANPAADVVILEKNNRILKKLLATGNGRCNFTNVNADDISHYYGESPDFAIPALRRFGAQKTRHFFEGIGVLSVEEDDGKIFPMSLQAASVVDMLRLEAERLGIEVCTETDVKAIEKRANIFYINGQTKADKVVIATGGPAGSSSPGYGGYTMLKALGHSSTGLIAALVQLKTEKAFVCGLQGTRLDARVAFASDGAVVGEEIGELLFTEYGLSGSVIFSLSVLCHRYRNLTARVDFFPRIPEEDLRVILEKRVKTLSHLTMENFFTGLINKKVGQAVAKLCGVEKLSLPVAELTAAHIEAILSALKRTEIKILGTTGFKNAQVTAGGVMTKDFNAETMESKLVKGLYVTGEVLDIFGDCGGYNLQWAWSSGYAAGISAALEPVLQ